MYSNVFNHTLMHQASQILISVPNKFLQRYVIKLNKARNIDCFVITRN